LYICGLCAANGKEADNSIITPKPKKTCTEVAVKAGPKKQENSLSEDNRLLIEELKKSIDERLRKQRKELEKVSINTKSNSLKMTFHFTIVSIFACVAIAIAGIAIAVAVIVLGLGAYRSYLDHKQIYAKLEKKLDEKFAPWLTDRKKEHKQTMNKMFADFSEKCDSEMKRFMYHVRLRFIIEQPEPVAEDIYPMLTFLVAKPSFEDKTLFIKIKNLNINPEITAKANEGLNKLKNRKK